MNTSFDFSAAEADAALCRQFHRLKTEQDLSGNQAATVLGKSPAWFSLHFPRWQRGGVAALLPERRALGAQRQLFPDLPPWFLAVARFYYLLSNRTHTRGSIPEAVRCAISLPHCPPAVQARLLKIITEAGWKGEKLPSCPPDLRAAVLARAQAGQPMLPHSLTRQITVAAPFVKQFRNPTDAGLDYISAHGTQMLWREGGRGRETFIHGGDVVEADDATINFPVCVPWPVRGCPCSERYGVKCARFQWLVAIDAGSRKVLGFSYTARPKASYRAEDVLSLMRVVCQQHGAPRAWRLEKGIWAANRITDAVRLMGAERISVHSPHSKPFIEGLFNKLWTKLSMHFPDASVGRYRGDGEEASRLLTACQLGQQDPRRHFPMLAEVLAAFHEVIAAHNSHAVASANYGRWVPNDRWAADTAARPLAPLNAQSGWIFSPFVRTWTVRGHGIGGKVPLFPGVSVPYNFQADYLFKFHAAAVRCYFDPADPHCLATLVLAQAWGNHRAGEVIGTAPQVNRTTDYIRLAMGWGTDGPGGGAAQLRAAHTALRREVRGIAGPKSPIAPVSESLERDGQGNLASLNRGTEPPPAACQAIFCQKVAPGANHFSEVKAGLSSVKTLILLKTRTGKIARLPLAIRDELNARLRNGQVGARLVEWLNTLKEVREVLAIEFKGVPITDGNLSEWRKGGFADWLRSSSSHNETNAKPPSLSSSDNFTVSSRV